MGDDCADGTTVAVRASRMKAQLKESMRISIAIVKAIALMTPMRTVA